MARKKITQAERNAVYATLKRGYDRFMALSDEEKTREAEEAAMTPSKPLTPAERAMFDEMGIGSAGRPEILFKPGRPPKGQGARHISVTVERGLLLRVDHHVQTHKLTRAQFIARALESALAA